MKTLGRQGYPVWRAIGHRDTITFEKLVCLYVQARYLGRGCVGWRQASSHSRIANASEKKNSVHGCLGITAARENASATPNSGTDHRLAVQVLAMALALHEPFTRLLGVTASKRMRGVGPWGMETSCMKTTFFYLSQRCRLKTSLPQAIWVRHTCEKIHDGRSRRPVVQGVEPSALRALSRLIEGPFVPLAFSESYKHHDAVQTTHNR